jgi:hypothetical protein
MAKSPTIKDLDRAVIELNVRAGTPQDQYTRTDRGTVTSNAGNYHLQWAYGGVKLCQNSLKGGGSVDISTDGFGTKRQCYTFIRAYMAGIQTGKESVQNDTPS